MTKEQTKKRRVQAVHRACLHTSGNPTIHPPKNPSPTMPCCYHCHPGPPTLHTSKHHCCPPPTMSHPTRMLSPPLTCHSALIWVWKGMTIPSWRCSIWPLSAAALSLHHSIPIFMWGSPHDAHQHLHAVLSQARPENHHQQQWASCPLAHWLLMGMHSSH